MKYSMILLFFVLLMAEATKGNMPVYTHVTCLYDINRGNLKNNNRRSFAYYLYFFEQLLQTDSNLIVFGDEQLQKFVWQRRRQHNTVFVLKSLSSFRLDWYYPYIQSIRKRLLNTPTFKYKGSPQYSLQFYNSIMMSKPFMLKQALQQDKFNSDFLIWIDAGYNHLFQDNIFYPSNVVQNFFKLLQPQWIFITYTVTDLFDMGFSNGSQRYTNKTIQVDKAILAGNFGGYIEVVEDITNTFENLLRITLEYGDMNSDESVFAIMPFKYPYLIPNTIKLTYIEYLDKINIYEQYSRKSQHPRFYRLQGQGQNETGNSEITSDKQQTATPTKGHNKNREQFHNHIEGDQTPTKDIFISQYMMPKANIQNVLILNASSQETNSKVYKPRVSQSASKNNSQNRKNYTTEACSNQNAVKVYKKVFYRLVCQLIASLIAYISMANLIKNLTKLPEQKPLLKTEQEEPKGTERGLQSAEIN